MSSASFEAPFPADRNRGWAGRRRRLDLQRRAQARRQQQTIESLEARTLMAVLPPAILDPQRLPDSSGLDSGRSISQDPWYESAPALAINAADPQKLVATWTYHNPQFAAPQTHVAGAAYSSDGGNTWSALNSLPGVLRVFPNDAPEPFAVVSDTSVAFDRNGFLYLAQIQHSADLATGALVVASYDFRNGTPIRIDSKTLSIWNQGDDAYSQTSIRKPRIYVDDTLPTFTDPTTGRTLTNPGAGNVYLVYGTDVPPPDGVDPWNRNTIEILTAPAALGGRINPLNFNVDDPQTVGSSHFSTALDSAPRLTISQGRLAGTYGSTDPGVTPGQVTVVYDDSGSFAQSSPPLSAVRARRFTPQADGTLSISGALSTIATTTIVGSATSPYPTEVGAAGPQGVGPAPVIASDNTLGSTSPVSGRLYVAYVDRYDVVRDGEVARNNPADNTDIRMAYSDNGGQTWTRLGVVNDDAGLTDGFSEANIGQATPDGILGRPQFLPELAVDRQTGAVALTYRDARYDAARVRTAVSLQTSIDGKISFDTAGYGSGRAPSFGAATFFNAPQRAYDAAARQDVVLGPIPDNQFDPSTTYTSIADVGGYGDSQGLVFLGGKVIQAWASNVNGGDNGHIYDGDPKLDIRVATALVAAGPRVVASTMGPIGGETVRDLDGQSLSLNNRRTADGTPIADGLLVTFDRPIDPSTFGTTDVKVVYRSPNTSGAAAGIPVAVVSVTPVENGVDTASYQKKFGATKFLVRFADVFNTGTISYTIGSDIRDRVASVLGTRVYSASRLASNLPAIPPVGTGGSGNSAQDTAQSQLVISGVPAAERIRDVNVRLSIQHTDVRDLILRLVSPSGKSITLAANVPTTPASSYADFTDTTFDDEAARGGAARRIAAGAPSYTGSFRPVGLLSTFDGETPNGTWTLTIEDTRTGNTGKLLSWGLELGTIRTDGQAAQTGNLMDQDADARPGEDPSQNLIIGTAPGDLYAVPTPNPVAATRYFVDAASDQLIVPPSYEGTTLPLIIPGPSVVRSFVLATKNGTTVRSTGLDSLVTDVAVNAVHVVFDRDMDPASFETDGRDVLQVMGPDGRVIPGPYTVEAAPNSDPNAPNSDPNPARPRTYKIKFATPQTLSGTYTVTLGPNILSAGGRDAIDRNQNAGLDVLRGTPSAGLAQVSFGIATTVPIASTPGTDTTFSSALVVPENFSVKDVNVLLNISFPRVTYLSAKLVGPNGTVEVPLFTNPRDTAPFANFVNTAFDDSATTPIQNGGAPYNSRYNPQQPLAAFVDTLSAGVWQLQVTVSGKAPAGLTGSIGTWGVQLSRPISNSGLGEPVSDRTPVSFRIFSQDPTNPLAANAWTAVGPTRTGAKVEGGNAEVAGRIGAIAIDPSDPSGNTAYVAGASGGLWKTINFLTTDPSGPTYIPLIDDAPTLGLNVSSIAIFGRNNDPNQSIIYAATGDADAAGDPSRFPTAGQTQSAMTTRGVGFLRSSDGGRTWELLDSTDNRATLPFSQRDHAFASVPGQWGTAVTKVVVDPKLTPDGNVTVYASVIDIAPDGGDIISTGRPTPPSSRGGLWRSLDSGATWTRMRAGQATDIALDLNSVSNTTGNLNFLYVGFADSGVWFSPNRGQSFQAVLGQTGNPLIQVDETSQPIPVNPINRPTPNGTNGGNPQYGKIVLARPALTGDPLKDLIYQGWTYAALVSRSGDLVTSGANASALVGLFLTKDFGQNWTRIALPSITQLAVPTNDASANTDYTLTGSTTPRGSSFQLGNYNFSLAIDPNDADVVYLGATNQFQQHGLMRIDTTGVHDPHAFYLDNRNPDGGLRRTFVNSVDSRAGGPVIEYGPSRGINPFNPNLDPARDATINLIRDPANPFVAGATVLVTNTQSFTNDGSMARWTPFDKALKPDVYANPRFDPWGVATRGVHRIVTIKDAVTGKNRLIFGTDQGVYTAVDKGDGTLVGSIGGVIGNDRPDGDVLVVQGSRNGNLQIAQLYAGAAQPSYLSAQLAALSGFFYGNSEDIGQPASDPELIQVGTPGYGDLTWSLQGGSMPIRGGSRGGIATQQDLNRDPATGAVIGGGSLYAYRAPEMLVGDDGRPSTDTFQVDNVGRTFGMYQQAGAGDTPDGQWSFRRGFNFAVNPLSGDQMLISSATGRVFSTETQGRIWTEIGAPGVLDGTNAIALAYGAPDPAAPGGGNILNYFLYAGTAAGNIFVTLTGGGGSGNQWANVSTGLDGSPVQMIAPNPARGAFDAYAVTQRGVYYNPNVKANAAWQNISGNLFSLTRKPLDDGAGDDGTETALKFLTAIVPDWRYVIPNNFSNPAAGTHPMLYAAGFGGVYRSLDQGQTWSFFPDSGAGSLLTSPLGNGGGLPTTQVTDLDLSLGNIDPVTGRANTAGGPNVLVASTYGRGQFVIRLAPIVFPNQTGQPRVLGLEQTVSSDTGLSQTDGITRNRTPFIVGYSEQTAFGNEVSVRLIDQTPGSATFGRVVGIGKTDEFGKFRIQIVKLDASENPVLDGQGNPVPADLMTFDGPKVLGVQATNASGTRGNLAIIGGATGSAPLVLDTTPPQKANLLDLQAASDTGLNPADEITNPNLISPPATGKLTFNATYAPTDNLQATLLRNGVVVGAPVIGSGSAILVDPGTISPDGVYAYRVRLVDLAGNESEPSDPLNVRIDTRAPAAPPRPTLDPNRPNLPGGSDTGVVGDPATFTDGITSVRRPFFIGSAEGNDFPNPNDPSGQVTQFNVIQMVDSGGNEIGRSTIDKGQFSVQPNRDLADGTYNFRFRVIDLAGNQGPLSPAITVVIQGTVPSPRPTLQLVAVDDTGTVGDNVTNIVRPRLQGTGQPGLAVQLIDVLGNITGAAGSVIPYPAGTVVTVDITGSYLLRFPTDLPLGTYQLRARTIDIAGNFADSETLTLQIIPQDGAGNLPTPVLTNLFPADDTGRPGDFTTSIRLVRLVGDGAGAGNQVALFRAGDPANPSREIARSRADAQGRFVVGPAGPLSNGTIQLVARVVDLAGNYGPASAPITLRIVTTPGDLNADGRADLANFTRGTGTFNVQSLAGSFRFSQSIPPLGQDTIPIQGDFVGIDGLVDYGYVRRSTMVWTIAVTSPDPSQAPEVRASQFGQAGDLPVPADYDGDGRTDLAVYRPTTAQWIIQLSNGGSRTVQFGQPGVDRPVPADYDGDGKADLATFRPTNATWWSITSTGLVIGGQQFGAPGGSLLVNGLDAVSIADYDGDGRADLGLYRPSTGQFLVRRPFANQNFAIETGVANAVPVPQDYDADGIDDAAVFNATTGAWTVRLSTTNQLTVRPGGPVGSVPLGAPLIAYRLPTSSSGTNPGGPAQSAGAGGGTVRLAVAGSGSGSAATTGLSLGAGLATGQGRSTTRGSGSGGSAGSSLLRQQDALRNLEEFRAAMAGQSIAATPLQAAPNASLALGLNRRRGSLTSF